jgi:hypothetical protein
VQHRDNLIWIDLEMTGLKPESDTIIEIATVVTDAQLNVLAEGPVLAIHTSDEILAGMDEWNTRQHGASGLAARVRESRIDLAAAERQTLEFLREWVPGVTLAEMLDTGWAFDLPQSLRIAGALAEAIAYLHRNGRAHGAICPRSVLIDTAGEVRLTGLGVARALESVDVTAPLRDPYAAPERVAWMPWDGRADTFSLAAMMFELLWGRAISALGREAVVGLEINANHLRAVRQGTVTGTARALHVGRSTQVWEIRIENEAGKPVCISRITLAVVPVA